jgi:hypothetical protein
MLKKESPLLKPYLQELLGELPPNVFMTRNMPSTEENLAVCDTLETDQLGCRVASKPTTRILKLTFRIRST